MAASRINVILGLSTRAFDSEMKKFERKMNRLSRKLERTGKALTTQLTMPIALAGGAAVKLADQFGTSMLKIETLVGIASDEVARLGAVVKEVSRETSIPMQELADALFVVTSAGLRGADAVETLTNAAKLSAIGLGETKEIARATTAIMQAYADENITAARASEILMATVREGNLEASELAPALGRVIGIASQMGVSFEEVGASVATFTRLGVSSEEAITGLRGVLTSLIAPSEGAREAMAEIGYTSESLREAVSRNGLAGTMIELIERFGGNTEALAELIPNVRALGAVLGTAGAQGDAYVQVLDNITNSTGMVDDSFSKVTKDSSFKFRQALSDLQTVGIELGNVLLPAVVKLADKFAAFFQKIASLDSTTKNYIVSIGLLVAAVGPAILIISKLIIVFKSLALVVAAINFKLLAIVAIFAAVSAAVVYIVANFDGLIERFVNLSNTIKNSVLGVFQQFLNKLADLAEWGGFDASWLRESSEGMDDFKAEISESKIELLSFGDILAPLGQKVKDAFKFFDDNGGLASNVKAVKQEIKEIGEELRKFGGDTGLTKLEKNFGNITAYVRDFTAQMQVADFVTVTLSDNMQNAFDKISQAVDIAVTDAIAGTAAIIGELAAQGASINTIASNIGTFLLDTLANLMINVGLAAIGVGKAVEAIKAALIAMVGIPAIAAGAALVALGFAVKGFLASKANSAGKDAKPVPFADGGIVSGTTFAMVGEYAGAKTNPEVIAPLDKLLGIMGAALSNLDLTPSMGALGLGGLSLKESQGRMQKQVIQVDVSGRISGRDILISSTREQTRLKR